VAPNQLNREFTVPAPDKVYVGDITYLPTGEGWLYLAVVLDLCSRAVVGWSMANHMRAELVTQALSMAIGQRQPAAGLIMHTDRGSQYGAESLIFPFREFSQDRRGFAPSPSWNLFIFNRLSSSLDNHNNFLLAAASNGAWFPSSLIEKGI
jgi:putative transposase